MAHSLTILGSEPGVHSPASSGSASVLPAGKPYAMLCLVALTPGGVPREDLAKLLWPESPPDRARASVRQALHVIRRALGPDVLQEEDGTLSLSPDALRLDLADLDAAIQAGDLQGAHALWQGGPFCQFSLGDAPGFNDWADGVRGRYEARLADALVQRATGARNQGSAEDALTWLERAIDVRPYDEEAHLARVELLLDLHRVEDAEQALAWATTVVDQPDVEAMEQLRDRLSRLRRAAAADQFENPGRPTLQFVGRTSEIADLRSHWRSVLRGRPRSVVLMGEPGVGKTRLAEEFLAYSVESAAAVVRAKAVDTERALDFGIVVTLVKELIKCPGGAGITNASLEVFRQLIPSLGNGSDVHPFDLMSEVGLADALADLVEAVSHEAALVVFVDDLQWADTKSRTLLLRLARSVRRGPVFFLSTCRSTDADDSVLRPLRQEARAGRTSLVPLRPLSLPETRECLAYTMHVEPPTSEEELVERLFASSQGNPLFLGELLGMLREDGILERVDTAWVCQARRMPVHVRLPSSIREILEQRLAVLGEAERAVVVALGRQGGSVAEGHLAREAELAEDVAARTAASLVEAGLVVRGPRDTLRLAHDALVEVARALLPAPARPGSRRRTWVTAVAVVVLAAIPFAVHAFGERAAGAGAVPLPMGGGVVYAMSGNAVLRILPPHRPGGSWAVDTVVRRDRGAGPTAVWSDPEGHLDVISTYLSAAGRTEALRIRADGSLESILQYDGDVNIHDFSPDGRNALLTVAEDRGGVWGLDLVHLSLESGRALPVRRLGLGGGTWIPDGSGIVATVQAEPDTVLVLRPDGVTLWSRTITSGGLPTRVCAFDRNDVVATRTPPGELTVFTLLHSDGSTLDAQPKAPARDVSLACSPQGHRVAFAGLVGGVPRLVLQDLASGDTLLGPPVQAVIRWYGDAPRPVPEDVRVGKDTVHLDWGADRKLRAQVRFSDGTLRPDTLVRWASLDPHVAYASVDGRLFGNGGGRTRVVASVYGWISDTVDVVVSADKAPADALFADRFATFDTARWVVFGTPSPVVSEVPGGPALDMRGDGVGNDGIISRRGFDLSKGATLELEFRLPLTRRDRQHLIVSLTAFPPGTDSLAGLTDPVGYRIASDQVAFEHPVGELAVFDSTTFAFGGIASTGRISRPDLFPSNAWRHLAIVLAPDGGGRLFLDRQHVADLPLPATLRAGDRWHVQIFDRAADTHAMIRNLVLWQGMRY